MSSRRSLLNSLESNMRDRRTTEFVLNVFLKAKPDVAYSPTEVYHMGGFLVNKKAPTFIVNRLPKLMESIGWRRIKVGMRGRYIYHGKEFKPSTVAQRNRRAPSILELQDVLTKLKKSHDKLSRDVKTLQTTVKNIQEGLLQRGNS